MERPAGHIGRKAALLMEGLEFSREAIADGEVWRLLGAAFAHLSWAHFAGNLALLGLVLVVVRPHATPREAVGVFAFVTLATTGGLWFGSTLDWYAGASGPLYGLLAWGAARLPAPLGPGLLLGVVLVVFVDQGRTQSWLGEPLAPAAHYWGLVGGLSVLLAAALADRLGRQPGSAMAAPPMRRSGLQPSAAAQDALGGVDAARHAVEIGVHR